VRAKLGRPPGAYVVPSDAGPDLLQSTEQGPAVFLVRKALYPFPAVIQQPARLSCADVCCLPPTLPADRGGRPPAGLRDDWQVTATPRLGSWAPLLGFEAADWLLSIGGVVVAALLPVVLGF